MRNQPSRVCISLVDQLTQPLPLRQWPPSAPKPLYRYPKPEPAAITAAIPLLLRVVEAHLRQGRGASMTTAAAIDALGH